MAVLVPPHDRRVCARCTELAASELMLPAPAPAGISALLMAERYHPRRVYDLVLRRLYVAQEPWEDPDILWGEPA